ncbi:MAG: sigma-E processing peptidase SpoIIGA [Sporanaerobacter sp.]|uniref:sigma-E processing peptidase SpoIIGA n=2 Tax=Sporanaerobacter TaxID=165812 RepID=UPI003A0FC2D2
MDIYVEYLLLENVIINYIILYAVKAVSRTDSKKIRLFIAACVGSLYTLVIFFPSLNFMTKFSVKFSISILIIILAFNPEKFSSFIRLLAIFYTTSFVFAGATLGLFYIFNSNLSLKNGAFYIQDFSVEFLILGISLSFILVKYIFEFLQIRLNKKNILTNVIINLNEKKAEIVALVDTGNSLKEPISQNPVIIVEFHAIKELLPKKVQDVFIANKELNLDLDTISNVMVEVNNEIKLRVIPFKSIGKEYGILLGFKPDKIIIDNERCEKKVKENVLIGIYNNKLSRDDNYMALLNPEILY